MKPQIDDTDRQILTILQRNARTSNADIAREVGLAASATLERIRRLEERGVLLGYEARVSAPIVGASLTAFVFVRADESPASTDSARAIGAFPEVQEVHHVAGEDCILVKVRVADTEALGRLLRERIGALPAVRSTRTTIVLQTVKETATLPLNLGEDR